MPEAAVVVNATANPGGGGAGGAGGGGNGGGTGWQCAVPWL